MEQCDVLIVGGGPAGSTCAARLQRAGYGVIVIDRAAFPRDKVCGGWITPQVVSVLGLDIEDYRRQRTLQPITGFRTGTIGGSHEVETRYGRIVSYGIRRCEFDEYLLRRSGAAVRSGTPVVSLRRERERWIVNERVSAPMLVGAGGHFCPVARRLNGGIDPAPEAPLVVAQEVEFAIESSADRSFTTAAETPELYFCGDLNGYGWCFRKQNYINIGFGRADRQSLPKRTAEFVGFLERKGTIPHLDGVRWHGHAYLLRDAVQRRVTGDGVLLVGDAAGLAYPQSGEGIRPAVESGLLAAMTIIESEGRYARDRLASYEHRLRARFGTATPHRVPAMLPRQVWSSLGAALLTVPAFVRYVALDRWFLHANSPPLSVGCTTPATVS
jgi:flavin-dependent dehydrogenase